MALHVSELFLGLAAGAALLFLPGLALLNWAGGRDRLDAMSCWAIAPGISLAVISLIFLWTDLAGVKIGQWTAWLVLLLAFLRCVRSHRRWRDWKVGSADSLVAVSLIFAVGASVAVRILATWGWLVPPGGDSAHHSLIVKMLLAHGGLFQSWFPYEEAQSFSYHFGFHAFAAFVAWVSGLEPSQAVFVTGCLLGLTTGLGLFALTRLFTTSPWAGVVAVVTFSVFSAHLFVFDFHGRWAALAGLTAMSSALVLLASNARSQPMRVFSGRVVLCAITVAGLGLTQYKISLIFTVLALVLFLQFMLERTRTWTLVGQFLVIGSVALLLVLPRVPALAGTKTGRMLHRTVIEAAPANPAAYGAPEATVRELISAGFVSLPRSVLSVLALIGAGCLLVYRRSGAWFVIGWLALLLLMNPAFVGSKRSGLIDENLWRLVVLAPVAVCVGVFAGLLLERAKSAGTVRAGMVLASLLIGVSLITAIRREPLPKRARFFRDDDLRMMRWIQQHVPPEDRVAGLAIQQHGLSLGFDASIWISYFTQRKTNHTNPVAALEKGLAEQRESTKAFTRELYQRDMSLPEAGAWMREQGFSWFYLTESSPKPPRGIWPEEEPRQSALRDQLMRNPSLEIAHHDEGVYLLRVN